MLDHFSVHAHADNGRDLDKATIKRTHDALTARHVAVTVIEPGSATAPLATGEDVSAPRSCRCSGTRSLALKVEQAVLPTRSMATTSR
jgi:hypothetical protein